MTKNAEKCHSEITFCEIKNIYDRYPEMQIVFTGSSMLQIDNSLADLSRRCVLAIDDIETGYGQKIPLWMFGLLE